MMQTNKALDKINSVVKQIEPRGIFIPSVLDMLIIAKEDTSFCTVLRITFKVPDAEWPAKHNPPLMRVGGPLVLLNHQVLKMSNRRLADRICSFVKRMLIHELKEGFWFNNTNLTNPHGN